jgi:polyphosphate glucokinase
VKVLAIDIGGTHVKILATGETEKRELPSGPTLTPSAMARQVKVLAAGWEYDCIAMGYPGPVLANRPVAEPHNLAPGWVGFDFAKAFGCPVKIVNDAAMQALGSYRGGKMLFLGFGTGLGTTLIADGIVEPMELGHLPYRKATYEDYVGRRGLERLGKKKWRERVEDVIERLAAALEPDDIVLGGGNAQLLKEPPPKCRLGDNANAFTGGFRLWESAARTPEGSARARPAANDGTSSRARRAPAGRKTADKTSAPRLVRNGTPADAHGRPQTAKRGT